MPLSHSYSISAQLIITMQHTKICTAPVSLQCKARSNIRCGVPSVKSLSKIEFYMSYFDVHSCCIWKCLRYAQIYLQYGQLWMSYVMCKFMCDLQYLICCMYSFTYNVSWSIYDISILLWSMSERIYVVSKNPFVCFNSFTTWAKIALSVSIFVASSLLGRIWKIIHLWWRL